MKNVINIFFAYSFMASIFLMFSTKFSFNGAALLSVPLVFIYFLYTYIYKKEKIIFVDFVMCFFMIFLLTSNLFLTFSHWRDDSAQIKNYLLSIVGVFLFFSLIKLFDDISLKSLAKILNFFIIFNVSFFYFQIIFFYVFGINLDVSNFFGGDGNRAITYEGVFRGTGIYDEPAIYSVFLSVLLISRLMIQRTVDYIILVAFFSILLSFSFVGIIISFFVAIVFLFRMHISNAIAVIFVFLLCFYVGLHFKLYPDFIIMRMENLFYGVDGSTGNKIYAFNHWMNDREVRLFGFGFIGLREWTPHYFDAIYDMTLFGTLLTQFGLALFPFILIWFFLFFYMNHNGWFNFFLFIIVFIKLSNMFYLLFWFYLAIYRRQAKKYHH